MTTSFDKQQLKELSVYICVCVQKFLVSMNSNLMSSVSKDAKRTNVNKQNKNKLPKLVSSV